MEQDTPSIAVRLRWRGMRFLEKTKIQHFLLASFQYLADLYPCSRMANNLNFGNCYGLTFPISRNQKSCAFVMAPVCNVCFTFETHSVVWLNCIALSSYRATALRYLFAAVLVQILRIFFVITVNSAIKEFFSFCLVAGASVNVSGIISQGLRPVVHFANVMHCFSLSAWQPHISYP